MKPSTLGTETSKCCVAAHCSVFTPTSFVPLSCSWPDARENEPGHHGIALPLSHSALGHGHRSIALPKITYLPPYATLHVLPSYSPDRFCRFPGRNKTTDFTTFSSLLYNMVKYEIPGVRSQTLDIVRGAYPETFGRLTPSKLLGEKVFSGPTLHPNEFWKHTRRSPIELWTPPTLGRDCCGFSH